MSKTWNRIELAKKCCEYLAGAGLWQSTVRMQKTFGFDENERAQMRQVLNKLRARGIVERSGVGLFKWRLSVADYNKDNPFLTKTDPKPTTQTTTYRVPSEDTYPHRERLKAIGCVWKGSDNAEHVPVGWYAPDYETLRKACEIVGCTITPPPATPKGDDVAKEQIVKLMQRVNELTESLKTAEVKAKTAEENANRAFKVLTIQTHEKKVLAKIEDVVTPKVYDTVMALAAARRNILLVGPAGCGKTHLAKLIADSLGLDFGSVSCTAGMSEAHLLGRSIPDFHTGKPRFVSTDFLKCYEEGGVFLMDEIDAADPNMLLAINSAIANGYCNVPNRPEKPRAIKHKDFIMIATANTFGRGATRVYAGRNQLDEATLDRYRIGTVECYYDPAIEAKLCSNETLRTRLQSIRQRIETAGLRRIMSTRFLEDAQIMHEEQKWSVDQIVSQFVQGWSDDERSKVL